MSTSAEMAAAVADMKSEIAADVVRGIMPATVTDFSTLHDYVDANMYAGFCDPDRRADWDVEELAMVQEVVDEWLATGALAKVKVPVIAHYITVCVEIHQEKDPRALLEGLAERYKTLTEREFKAGGEDLMGYDGVMVQAVNTIIKRGV